MNEPTPKKRDFPTWITPPLVKELRQGMRSPAFLITMSLFPAALSLVFLFSFIQSPNGPVVSPSLSNNLFWTLICFCLLIVIPLRALIAVKEEIDTRSINLLILTKLTSTRIIWGKWVSLISQSALILCLTLPFAVIRYYFGDINILQDLCFLLLIFVFGSALTAFSLWLSGTPALLRILASIQLIFCGIAFATMGFNINQIFGGDFYFASFWSSSVVFLFDAAIIIWLSLLLATKWFASPSENISGRIRCVMLLVLPLPFLILLLPKHMISANFMGIQTTVSFATITIALILEGSVPTPFLPSHVVKTSCQRFGWFRRLFLLPGWPGAAQFGLLATLIFIGLLLLFLFNGSLEKEFIPFSNSSSTPNNSNDNALLILALGLSWWAGFTTILWILSPFQKKLESWSPVVYFFLIGLFAFMAVVCASFGDMGQFISSLIPGGITISILSSKEVSPMVFFSIITGIVAMIVGSSSWRKTHSKGMEALRAKRRASSELPHN